jgi:hypothetical protein
VENEIRYRSPPRSAAAEQEVEMNLSDLVVLLSLAAMTGAGLTIGFAVLNGVKGRWETRTVLAQIGIALAIALLAVAMLARHEGRGEAGATPVLVFFAVVAVLLLFLRLRGYRAPH